MRELDAQHLRDASCHHLLIHALIRDLGGAFTAFTQKPQHDGNGFAYRLKRRKPQREIVPALIAVLLKPKVV
ncbi:hypothetical protein D3C83_143240 [compost metagenome]